MGKVKQGNFRPPLYSSKLIKKRDMTEAEEAAWVQLVEFFDNYQRDNPGCSFRNVAKAAERNFGMKIKGESTTFVKSFIPPL